MSLALIRRLLSSLQIIYVHCVLDMFIYTDEPSIKESSQYPRVWFVTLEDYKSKK